MKKLMLVVFCFYWIASPAQNGFYLQPQLGVGSSGVLAHDNLKLGTYQDEGRSSVSVADAELGIGYRLNRLELSSGIFFLRSGYFEHTLSGYSFLTDTRTTQYYKHISLPAIASYRFLFGKRFSVAPGFGYEISYNYADQKTMDQNGTVSKETLTGSAFTSQYQGVSLWALVRVGLEYKLGKTVQLVAGPELHDMLTSMLPAGYNVAAYQYSRIFSLDAGIQWSLAKR